MTMLTSWKLDPYTLLNETQQRQELGMMFLRGGGGHLAGSSTIFPKQRAREQARNVLNMTEKLPTT